MKQRNIVKLIHDNQFEYMQKQQLNDTEQGFIIGLALSILSKRHAPGKPLTNPEDTENYLRLRFAEYKREVFGMLFLDNQHCVLRFETLFYGTIDGASIYPRVIVQRALELNAAALIATHNHPSGIVEPSTNDRKITDKIKQAVELVDIRFLDHIIVSAQGTYSFATHGLL